MLQNHCKGTDFSPNNQKKTQKKHKLATFFRFRLAMECRNGNKTTNGAGHMEALSIHFLG